MSRSKNKNPGRAQKHWFLKASSGNLRCRWPDSNRHGVNRLILSQVRLPIPPQRLKNTEEEEFSFSSERIIYYHIYRYFSTLFTY